MIIWRAKAELYTCLIVAGESELRPYSVMASFVGKSNKFNWTLYYEPDFDFCHVWLNIGWRSTTFVLFIGQDSLEFSAALISHR